ncbi:MAG: hypothetical protein IKI01_02015 [Lachnospiraceae bacterium]|nr:hypothetical protein [Lachnospiraceae bacterium]
MKTTKIRKLFHRPVAVVMAALLAFGGIAGLASADDVQGPVTVGAGEHKTINGGIICIDSSSQVALLVDASDGEVGAKDASVTVKGNIEMSSDETGSLNHYAVFVQEKDGHASAEVEGDVTLTDLNSFANTYGLYTATQTAGVQTPPSIHVTGKLKVKGLNPGVRTFF